MDDDPGWGLSLRTLVMILVPGGMAAEQRRADARGADGLVLLRQLCVAFLVSLGLFGVVLAFIYAGPLEDPMAFAPWLVLAVGVGGLVGVPFVERPLDCASDASLAATYRTRFFLRVAAAQAPALFGFVGFFLTAWWLYPLGLAFALVGFARLAPTVRHLAADQEVLLASGCNRDLVHALRHPAGSGPGGDTRH
ncbi:MAG: hypothetical protein KDB35_00385 [Acidimicrobiales bacterium]|nr:hypothetical protein [Acidimicrobiales bacterium]MCB1014202.1 hypothetical protein [Acidimicrobiales bacterium]MCB9372752.1 hypothetical protein [Microthrixaceae bacterium]